MKQILLLTGMIIYFSIQIQQQISLQNKMIYIPEQTKYSQIIKAPVTKIKIAIIDTEVNWKDPLLYPYLKNQYNKFSVFSNPQKYDHATMVTSVLIYHLNQVFGEKAKDLFEIKVFSCKYYESTDGNKRIGNLDYYEMLDKAIQWNPNIINISSEYWDKNVIEQYLINEALRKNITVVASAGNLGNSDLSYPCSFDGVVCVGAKNKISNYGKQVSIVVNKSKFLARNAKGNTIYNKGTSLASPVVSAYYASLLANPSSQEYFNKLIMDNKKFQRQISLNNVSK